MEEFSETTWFGYHDTPSPANPCGCTSAEILIGYKLCTFLNALITTYRPTPIRAQPGVHNVFSKDPLVYTRKYRPNHDNWSETTVTGQGAKVVFDVSFDDRNWVRHLNQPSPQPFQMTTDLLQQTLRLYVCPETTEHPASAHDFKNSAAMSVTLDRPSTVPSENILSNSLRTKGTNNHTSKSWCQYKPHLSVNIRSASKRG
ncbi:hypothetical protein CRM22_008380 [Opisthorchis felineus]|uniref:Uncharacterized protein n=1 Tax=Opisthorchis felineus TaxID=147828 RepID=A0A4S2LIG6_OPIFE|nr:hypothetical protein CRM22_008380 [Opisthorchis felineus]